MNPEEIHPAFSDWYGDLQIQISPEQLKARWQGVCALLSGIDQETVLSLVANAAGFELSDTQEAALRGPFKDVDPLFRSSGNDNEFGLLVESALAFAVDPTTKVELKSFAAVATVAALGLRSSKLAMRTQLLARARAALERLGQSARERPSAALKLAPPKLDLTAELEQFNAANSVEQIRTLVRAVADKTQKLVSSTHSAFALRLGAAERLAAIKDEELDLLWWTTNKYSDLRDSPLAKLPDGERGLAAGVEIAGITQFTPSPATIKPILLQAGIKPSKKIGIAEAVNASDVEWLKSVKVKNATPLTPISYAILKRLEVEGEASWVEPWAKICRVDNTQLFSEIDLAVAAYLEAALLRDGGPLQ